ncbi:hypothetical protein, partial [Tamlana crocina]|uniref:hypothetical protein n=1 Tax=Tamlana crocina TaxID=393006 RepID=UPI001ADDDA12
KEGILFLLHILNELAESFGLQRNEYKATTDKKIFFPSQKFLNDHGDKVVFSPERIREICHRLKIDSKIIGEFSASPGYFTNNYTENTFLIERPFIKIGDICYLLLPSSQMYCMNSFIFR